MNSFTANILACRWIFRTIDAKASSLVDAALSLRPVVLRHAGIIERDRRIHPEVLAGLSAMNAFNLQLGERYGGPNADPVTHLRVIETLSSLDGSVGWCAMVGSESSACINAYLEPSTVQEMLVDANDAITALTAVGTGRADCVDGGYVISGRWRFASGCRHATWLGALCTVHENDAPKLKSNGKPEMVLAYAPASAAVFFDTWRTSGLQGTASDDFEIEQCFVPAERCLDLFGAPLDENPLCLLPPSLRFAMSKAAAVCGIARGAMDALVPLLERTPFAGQRAAREEPRVHSKFAQAQAAIEGGRAYLYDSVAQAWHDVQHSGAPTLKQIAAVRLAVVFAAQQAVEAVHLIQALGGTASALDSRLDRAVRDINVARQHLQLQDHVVEDVGRVLFDLPPFNPLF